MTTQARQGDLLFVPVTQLPAKVTPVAPEHGRLILARGEATGHHHSIPAHAGATLVTDAQGVMYLTVDQLIAESVPVEHQEHGTIPRAPGVYRVVRQREYAGDLVPRVVVD